MPLGPARGRGTEQLRAGAAQGGPAAALSRNAGLGLGASFASRRAARCGKSTAGRSALRLWPCGRGRVGSVPLPELWSAAPFVSARRSLRFFPGGLVKASEPSLLRVGGAVRCDAMRSYTWRQGCIPRCCGGLDLASSAEERLSVEDPCNEAVRGLL